MTDQEIQKLSRRYRAAIEAARDDGRFSADATFKNYPRACCGETSYLLAEYLKAFGVETIWYSTRRKDCSHAWLVVKDERVKRLAPEALYRTKELHVALDEYEAPSPRDVAGFTRYKEDELRNGLIIDITADQFTEYDIPVYVGYQDAFHQTFTFIQAHDYAGKLCNQRQFSLYQIIKGYL